MYCCIYAKFHVCDRMRIVFPTVAERMLCSTLTLCANAKCLARQHIANDTREPRRKQKAHADISRNAVWRMLIGPPRLRFFTLSWPSHVIVWVVRAQQRR